MNVIDIMKQMDFCEKYGFTIAECGVNGIVFNYEFATVFKIPKEYQTDTLHEVFVCRGWFFDVAELLEFKKIIMYDGHDDWQIPTYNEICHIRNNYVNLDMGDYVDGVGIKRFTFWYKNPLSENISNYYTVNFRDIKGMTDSALKHFGNSANLIMMVR